MKIQQSVGPLKASYLEPAKYHHDNRAAPSGTHRNPFVFIELSPYLDGIHLCPLSTRVPFLHARLSPHKHSPFAGSQDWATGLLYCVNAKPYSVNMPVFKLAASLEIC
jgi:hypothetical protein